KPVVRALLKPAVVVALVALEGGLLGALCVLGAAALVVVRVRSARSKRHGASSGVSIGALPIDASARRAGAACTRMQTGLAAVVLIALVLAVSSAHAQGAAAAPAREPATSSPRWMYSIAGGYTYPDLDDYDAFYGDDRDTSFSISGGYRLRDWLEVGARYGYSMEPGLGR